MLRYYCYLKEHEIFESIIGQDGFGDSFEKIRNAISDAVKAAFKRPHVSNWIIWKSSMHCLSKRWTQQERPPTGNMICHYHVAGSFYREPK